MNVKSDELQRDWEKSRPCATCELQDICRLTGILRTRPDFPQEYWQVSITCSRYLAKNERTVGRTEDYCVTVEGDPIVPKKRSVKVYGDNGQYK